MVLSQANSCTQARLDMFQLAFTWGTDQISLSFPSSRGSSTCPWYTVGGKSSDKNLEQRINIKCCVKIDKSVSETLALLTVAYGKYAAKKSSVFEWNRRFKEGREDVQDDPRSGQPKTQRTDANVDRVRTLVRSGRRLGVRVIAEELNTNRETVRQIVKENLGIRKISAKMVPRILTHDQKQRRLHISSDLLRNAEMFDRVITGEKMWCFQCDQETKQQSMQWKTQNSPRPKKSTHVSVAGQDHAWGFLRSQGDSSLWIHCTSTNGKSTVLVGSADKITGVCSEEKTRTLAW